MKQRTRPMLNEDDLGYNMVNSKKNDGDHEIQLHRMTPQEHYIEAQVQQGDTLQAIALRFHCTISELKRINQIHKDNEIFARNTIKVPITPYSVLTERIPIEQGVEYLPSTSNQSTNLLQERSQNIVNQQNTATSSSKEDNDCSIDCNTIVLNSTLAPAVLQYTDTEVAEPMTEDTQLLPNKDKIPVEAVVVKELISHGADFGLKWFHLVCFMLILGVIVPLWYVLFELDKHEVEKTDLPPLSS